LPAQIEVIDIAAMTYKGIFLVLGDDPDILSKVLSLSLQQTF